MDKTLSRLIGALIVGLLAVAAASLDQPLRLLIGLLLGMPSFVLMIIGRRQLGASFAVTPQAKALVTTGLYAKLQHPMYLFLDLFLVALIIAFGLPLLLILWALLVAVQMWQARREEMVLAAAFGAGYEAYRRRTWC